MTKTQTVNANGLSFRCRIDGEDKDAPWLVFSNSLVTNLAIWDAQADVLGKTFRILRYDQRGHGGTSVPTAPITFEQLGADALALLDHFGIERCTFIGLSMGVPTGLHLVSSHPERVERLVLCDGQSKTAATGSNVWAQRIAHAREDGMGAVADATLERWFPADFIADGRAEKVREMVASTPLDGFAGCAGALQNYNFDHALAAIDVPTMLVVGERDGGMPVSMRTVRDAIKGASLVEIPDAGHIPNFEQPEAFNRVLSDFLGKTLQA